MDRIVIKGGERLIGEVEVSGSKNATLPIFAANLLAQGPSVIHNVPNLRDVQTIVTLLKGLGVSVEGQGRTYRIDAQGISGYEAPYDLVKTMRASILVLGPLVAMMKKAKVSLPGGCAIGARPINLHLPDQPLSAFDNNSIHPFSNSGPLSVESRLPHFHFLRSSLCVVL